MRSRWTAGLVALAVGALGAPAAGADDVREELRAMQERMQQLEDRLQATNEQLEASNARVEQQQEMLLRSGVGSAGGSASGLAGFLETLEIGGWVAGSYLYNFNDPDGDSLAGANAGTGGFEYPFHPDANSFQIDQLWFELERPVDESNRAGFRADIVFGKTASILGSSGIATTGGGPVTGCLDEVVPGDGNCGVATVTGAGATGNDGIGLNSEDLEVYQAYVQYLAPIGNGVTFQFGKFGTTIGAEVAPTVYNFNITRGHVYNLFQPITHVGLLAATERGPWSLSVGLVNENVSNVDIDLNDNKSVLWHLGYGGETWGASFNGVWGSTDSFTGNTTADESNKEIILDLILSWDPSDRLSTYVNADWRKVENVMGSVDADGWGVAAAGRYALSDRLGVALRGEYAYDADGAFSGLGTFGEPTELMSLTGTLDYGLTDQLTVRGELRYDATDVEGASDQVFVGDGSNATPARFDDDQLVGAVEVIYNF